MPPKRKNVAEDTPTAAASSSSTRTTRSSTRIATNATAASTKPAPAKKPATTKATKKASSSKQTATESAAEVPPPAKKAKTTAATKDATGVGSSKTKAVATKFKGTRTVAPHADDLTSKPNHNDSDEEAGSTTKDVQVAKPSKPTTTAQPKAQPTPTSTAAPSKKQAQTTPPQIKMAPYTPENALALFTTYADADEPTVIDTEGFTQLCMDAQIPLEGALPLILAWQLGAKDMGKFTQEEWVKGTASLQISSLPQLAIAVRDLESLLIFGNPALNKPVVDAKKKQRAVDEPYDRTAYWSYAADTKAAFQKLYTFCFVLAKQEQARNIDMETATAFWSVLLVPQYPLMGEILEFINEKGTYKGVNKDLWSMMLEFCQTVKPSLQDYESDGAWPTLLDEFVSWKKAKTESGSKGRDGTAAEE